MNAITARIKVRSRALPMSNVGSAIHWIVNVSCGADAIVYAFGQIGHDKIGPNKNSRRFLCAEHLYIITTEYESMCIFVTYKSTLKDLKPRKTDFHERTCSTDKYFWSYFGALHTMEMEDDHQVLVLSNCVHVNQMRLKVWKSYSGIESSVKNHWSKWKRNRISRDRFYR